MNIVVENKLYILEQRILEKVDNLFTARPTWSRSPVLEHDLIIGIRQIIRDEFQRAEIHSKHNELDTNDN